MKYDIPQGMVDMIGESQTILDCRVIHNNQLTEPYSVETGVKQGCILSTLLLSLAINYILKETTKNERQGIQWTMTSELDDLGYADNFDVMAHIRIFI